MFWCDFLTKLEKLNKNFNKKLHSENSKKDLKFKIWFKNQEKLEIEKKIKEESLKEIINKINIKKFNNLDNWEGLKSKNLNINLNKKIKKSIKPLNLLLVKFNFIYKCFNNLNIFIFLKNIKNKTSFKNLFYFYQKINIKKIKNNEIKKYIYLIVNLSKRNVIINVMKNNKPFFMISSGLVFKNLNLNDKKNKKSIKLVLIAIKTLNSKINFDKKKIVINIKGLNMNENYTKIINYINKNLKKTIKTEIFFLKCFNISKNKKFGFKKIKAIKKKLKKKNLNN